jgi:hypothetical protein
LQEDYDLNEKRYAGLLPIDVQLPPPTKRAIPKAISHRWALEQRAKPFLMDMYVMSQRR